MDMKEAMYARHMVRKYTDKPLEENVIEDLENRVKENNDRMNLFIRLMVHDDHAVNALIGLILARGVKNYFILAGDDSSDLDEKLGYAAADLMLYAQTLGLNTWYVGGTYNHSVSRFVEGKRAVGIIAVGYGKNSGKPHKSKKPSEVSVYKGNAPDWFVQGVEASLLAPTALNKQEYMIIGEGSKVRINNDNGIFTGVNRGLIRYHFELGAGRENFQWVE
ncbi:MAG: nitroreductase family protein [Anaerovoracaceae bacterium]|jgi:hypothetical protein